VNESVDALLPGRHQLDAPSSWLSLAVRSWGSLTLFDPVLELVILDGHKLRNLVHSSRAMAASEYVAYSLADLELVNGQVVLHE
jgi:hypothetical protein